MSAKVSPDNPFAPRPPAKVYSVPRRYDLATLMAVTLAYALLFGAMRLLQAPPALIGFVSLFITLVGLGQALLFRGRRPRAASIVVGVLSLEAWLAWLLIQAYAETRPPGEVIFFFAFMAIFFVFLGTLLGYIAGTVIAGVFLVADLIRQLLRRMSGPKPVPAGDWAETTPDTAVGAAPKEQTGRGPVVWATIVGDDDSAGV